MSKLFKIIGIGSAIGVVAYGIIKYKQDEKFKEKVDEVANKTAETVKDKTEKVVTKAADFTARHPVVAAAGFFGILAGCRIMRNYQLQVMRQNYYSEHNDSEIDPDDPINDAYECDKRARGNDDLRYQIKQILVEPDKYVIVSKDEWNDAQKPKIEECEPREEIFSNWNEKYRENWDEVNKFARHLDLYSGESFMIEDPAQFDVDSDHPIVSHLVNGEGCYPPETKLN